LAFILYLRGVYIPDQRSIVWNDFLYRPEIEDSWRKCRLITEKATNNDLNINKIMKFEEYQSEASQTALYPRRMSNLEYPTLGLAGEAGEVANIVKKIQRDFGGEITDETRLKLKDELGDVLWYISACADELGLTLTEIAEFNVEKLAKRHNR
jgi:NTP pyrophosphatase (non-canonical NTP hydrolase)